MKRIKFIGLLSILVLSFAMMLTGCTKKLDEPIFVRNLISGTDMDFEIQYIANKGFEGEVVDLEIGNMPEGMTSDFYSDDVEEISGYDVHTISFGIATDDLTADGHMSEPFVFHELTVKWDDGSKTSADIGTIQVTATNPEYSLEPKLVTLGEEGKGDIIVLHATKAMIITGLEIPFPNFITEMKINGEDISNLHKEPIKVNEGQDIEINYSTDFSKISNCGNVFMEVLACGFDTNGNDIENAFVISKRQDEDDAKWIDAQIKNHENFSGEKMVVKSDTKADIDIISGGFDITVEDFIEEINKDLKAEGLPLISSDYKAETLDSVLEDGEGKTIEITSTNYEMKITDSIGLKLVSIEELGNKITAIALTENLKNGSKHDKNLDKCFSVISKNIEPRFNAPEFTIETTNKSYILDCLTFWCANMKENNEPVNMYVITTNEKYFGFYM